MQQVHEIRLAVGLGARGGNRRRQEQREITSQAHCRATTAAISGWLFQWLWRGPGELLISATAAEEEWKGFKKHPKALRELWKIKCAAL